MGELTRMCRFLAYTGPPITMDGPLFKPKNSLIKQSYQARERKKPLNGDGLGIGWYAPHKDPEPAVYVSTQPAWNDFNLPNLASKIQSGCFFAHIRAASIGSISHVNCHPFRYQELLMMHNGRILGFPKIRRELRQRLPDPVYDWIKGGTDSEHFFGLFLSHYLNRPGAGGHEEIIRAVVQALSELNDMFQQANVAEPLFLNVAITNGQCIVALRHAADTDDPPPTLYYAMGDQIDCADRDCRLQFSSRNPRAFLITSEKKH